MSSDQPVAFVTGAARGLGQALAIEFTRRKHRVAILDCDADGLKATAAAVRKVGGETLEHAGDLADLEFCERAIRGTVAAWGRMDVLVNNAAWRELTTMRQITPESWERTLRVSLTAPAFLARWAAEAMQQQRRGVIINISSIMSHMAGGTSPAYVAAKGALDSLTYELAALYGPVGIRVVAVNPGAIDTEMSRDYADLSGASLTERIRAQSEAMIMLGRWADPAEVARAVASIAGDDFSYLTGTSVVLDGGWSHQHSPLPLRRSQFPQDF